MRGREQTFARRPYNAVNETLPEQTRSEASIDRDILVDFSMWVVCKIIAYEEAGKENISV